MRRVAHNALNLEGQNFGRLVVVSRVENNKHGRTRWLCQCTCGNEKIVGARELKNGDTTSCGCLRRELTIKRSTTHGGKGTKEYRAWLSMKARCYNPNCEYYPLYGGRGIKICDSWRNSFTDFLSDMGECPADKTSIDRIDTNGDYEPKNCRWADWVEQANNRRIKQTNTSGVTGVAPHKSGGWVARISVNKKDIYLGYFRDKADAIKARKNAEKYYSVRS